MGTWIARKIRQNARKEKKLEPIPDKPFLTKEEVSASIGVAVYTICNWVEWGIIPRPRKWAYAPARGKVFRKSYVEILRDLIIIRSSSVGYSKLEDFKKLARNRLLGYR